jgi:hypothetical protein
MLGTEKPPFTSQYGAQFSLFTTRFENYGGLKLLELAISKYALFLLSLWK